MLLNNKQSLCKICGRIYTEDFSGSKLVNICPKCRKKLKNSAVKSVITPVDTRKGEWK